MHVSQDNLVSALLSSLIGVAEYHCAWRVSAIIVHAKPVLGCLVVVVGRNMSSLRDRC